jgi:NTE family protein
LADLANSLTRARTLSYFDLKIIGGGLIEGRWIVRFFRQNVEDTAIENAATTFGTVATDLHTGRETWLTSGSIIDAVRASIAVPGLLSPIQLQGRWLVDGALVNPLPVSLCRALGADVIIGVSLDGDLIRRPHSFFKDAKQSIENPEKRSSWLRWLNATLPQGKRSSSSAEVAEGNQVAISRPGYTDVIAGAFFIVQDFVSRVRLAADPADILLVPDVEKIGWFDFHHAKEAIAAGRQEVEDYEAALLAAARRANEAIPAASPKDKHKKKR